MRTRKIGTCELCGKAIRSPRELCKQCLESWKKAEGARRLSAQQGGRK
jgi:hypothetical protein